MKEEIKLPVYDLAVIGAGMSGMAAALFALNRGLKVIHTGIAGEIAFASGMFDLMGVHPVNELKQWENPWEAIKNLRKDEVGHPYARINDDQILEAFKELKIFLENEGRRYNFNKDKNLPVCTALGTIKKSWMIPLSMLEGSKAFTGRKKCLIVGFKGVKGFSAVQIAQTLKGKWDSVDTGEVVVPGTENNYDVYPEQIARLLDNKDDLLDFAKRVKPLIKDNQAVGFPAALGFYETDKIIENLEEILGVSVFEIPTMPPSVPGIRLKETFEYGLGKKENYTQIKKMIKDFKVDKSGNFILKTDQTGLGSETIIAENVLLASGRFTGKGLRAGRKKIVESIFNLPVSQPECRSKWLDKDFLAPGGHPVNRAGIEIDRYFRPKDNNGNAVFPNLFASGSILAHQDWKRMKCGTGLAVSTSFAAVESMKKLK